MDGASGFLLGAGAEISSLLMEINRAVGIHSRGTCSETGGIRPLLLTGSMAAPVPPADFDGLRDAALMPTISPWSRGRRAIACT
jgi:hypothetical protein